jgi:large subunit ribosomal protein L20
MIRVKRGRASHIKHGKILRFSKGFRGAHSRLFRTAKGQVMKSYLYRYVGRQICKRSFRRLCILRVNSWIQHYSNESSYANLRTFLHFFKVKLNLQVLSHIAILDPVGLLQVVDGLQGPVLGMWSSRVRTP